MCRTDAKSVIYKLIKMDEKKNIHIYLYFIGMLGSGKSSIINRLVNNTFSFVYNMTTEIT